MTSWWEPDRRKITRQVHNSHITITTHSLVRRAEIKQLALQNCQSLYTDYWPGLLTGGVVDESAEALTREVQSIMCRTVDRKTVSHIIRRLRRLVYRIHFEAIIVLLVFSPPFEILIQSTLSQESMHIILPRLKRLKWILLVLICRAQSVGWVMQTAKAPFKDLKLMDSLDLFDLTGRGDSQPDGINFHYVWNKITVQLSCLSL